jgi:hypothetical protein
MKLAVLDAVGGSLDYCDPDLYPVGRGTPLQNAEARLPQIRADTVTYRAILEHERITPGVSLTSEQKIAIDVDYKQIQSFELRPTGSTFSFTVYIPDATSSTGNRSMSGSVERTGVVHLEAPGPGTRKRCPICLAAGVTIGTPSGPVPIQSIHVGMAVWTTDATGRRVVARVSLIGRTLAPVGHEVVRLTLADGRTVVVSPGHPTADGRRIGDLRPGDALDGSVVARTALIPYTGVFTFDLLPAGSTGTYFADGILLGSTLGPMAASSTR